MIVIADYSDDDARLLTDEVQAEYARRYGGEGDSSPMDPAQFRAPSGVFCLGYVGEVPVAMGGWRRGGPQDGDAEIKRMYVRPAFARRGFARVLLAELERLGREAGLARLVLETGTAQPEAIALYASCDYTPIPPFGYYVDSPDAIHLAKRL